MAGTEAGGHPAATAVRGAAGLAALGLVFNAAVWGMSWWPLRHLEHAGLHPLWATTLIYLLAVVVITAVRPQAWRDLFSTPVLWVLVLAAGTTNASFNWAVTVGDVVRVVLLFYLMPLWAVLLARVLLGERLTAAAGVRVLMALAGAVAVLWPPEGLAEGGLPLPRNLAEALSVLGGFSFALNNVMLRREAHRPESARALAMFLGGAVVAGGLAAAMAASGTATASGPMPWVPPPAAAWVWPALALGAAFLLSNLALQYGAARLPANVTAIVMLTEVLFASVSAVLLGAGVVTLPLVLGGALIVGAALLAVR
ncbi:MAG: DMT family transporter [Rubrivivax sp.]|jgi:drug/metabolite transporter (DMT)-like permease